MGSLSVITKWNDEPLLLVESTEVEIVPFNEVGARHSHDEGEGDRSLAYWREVHWQAFGRDLRILDKEPAEDMPVVSAVLPLAETDRALGMIASGHTRGKIVLQVS